MAQKPNTKVKKDNEKPEVSQSEIDEILSRYDAKFDGDDEAEKQKKRQRIKLITERFIQAMNNLLAPDIDKLQKNTKELAELRELQKKDPQNPAYLQREIKLLKENADILGSLIHCKNLLAENGFLFKGIESKLPPGMDRQHIETNDRLVALGEKPIPVPLSHMGQMVQAVKNFFEDLKPQPKAANAPGWVKESVKEPEDTLGLRNKLG
ncbi:MAG TPA: hypothetical protein VHE99_09600 [Gammaproteobacteria bacterium]|nr:hypothetical protein [Gammaproteobacteria bacterium]